MHEPDPLSEVADLDEGFLSAVAHELRTPLAVIFGYGELIGWRDDEKTRTEASTMLLQAGARLSETVDELLLLLAVEGGVTREPTSFDLGTAVSAATEGTAGIATAAPESWPRVRADQERVERMVGSIAAHLLSLAEAGRAVVVSCAQVSGKAELTFTLEPADGASADATEQGARRGSLLRLRLACRLADACGGAMRAEPDGSGVWRFFATLPLAGDES